MDGVEFLCDVASLEAAVGSRQLPPMLKSIDVLDEHCTTLLARSPFAVVGYDDVDGRRRAVVVGGEDGFAVPRGVDRLEVPLPADAAPDGPVSTMFLIPGWREALRINGRRSAATGPVEVEEALVHCGKAVLRSKLWDEPGPRPSVAEVGGVGPLDAAARAFLAASTFVVMATADADGHADASPKGDPAGFVRILDDRTLAIPDRKGNRRTDSFHNLVDDPRIALVAVVPGDERTLEIRGTARVTDDDALRHATAERGKVPNAVLVVDVDAAELVASPAIAAARLWDPATHRDVSDLPKAGHIWTDHIKINGTKGVKAAAIRAAVNGSLVQRGTEFEYQRSLY